MLSNRRMSPRLKPFAPSPSSSAESSTSSVNNHRTSITTKNNKHSIESLAKSNSKPSISSRAVAKKKHTINQQRNLSRHKKIRKISTKFADKSQQQQKIKTKSKQLSRKYVSKATERQRKLKKTEIVDKSNTISAIDTNAASISGANEPIARESENNTSPSIGANENRQQQNSHLSIQDLKIQLKKATIKFDKACRQLVILDQHMSDLQSSYTNALENDRKTFKIVYRMQLATLEGTHNAYIEYIERQVEKIKKLKVVLFNDPSYNSSQSTTAGLANQMQLDAQHSHSEI